MIVLMPIDSMMTTVVENMSVHTVSLQEAEGHLSELAELAKQGNEVRITITNGEVVKLVSDRNGQQQPRILGLHKGKVHMPDDFDDALDDSFLLGKDH